MAHFQLLLFGHCKGIEWTISILAGEHSLYFAISVSISYTKHQFSSVTLDTESVSSPRWLHTSETYISGTLQRNDNMSYKLTFVFVCCLHRSALLTSLDILAQIK